MATICPEGTVGDVQGEASCQVIVPVPIEHVYAALTDLNGYPRWMRDVRRIGSLEDNRSRWVLHGPYGTVRWEVEATVEQPPHAFAWCNRGAGMVGYCKHRLEPLQGKKTRIETKRFLGTGRDKGVQSWWGDPAIRLRSDMGHFVEELRRRLTQPAPRAVRLSRAQRSAGTHPGRAWHAGPVVNANDLESARSARRSRRW